MYSNKNIGVFGSPWLMWMGLKWYTLSTYDINQWLDHQVHNVRPLLMNKIE